MRKKKESAYKTFIVCFWKHFKMKMSEIDQTKSLDPDQAQQNVWQDPKEKGPKDLNVQDKKKRYSACKELRQKRWYIWKLGI